MHRDYETNAPVLFYEYDDRIEVQNPGGLYGKASPANFPNVSDYRNPFIAEAMKVLGYVNRFSRGIYRVQKELAENGNGEASFDFSLITAFRVIEKVSERYFEAGFGVDAYKGGQQSERQEATKERPKKSPKTTQEIILEILKKRPETTQRELAQKVGISMNGIKFHIQKMSKRGIIKHEGPTKAGKWVIL